MKILSTDYACFKIVGHNQKVSHRLDLRIRHRKFVQQSGRICAFHVRYKYEAMGSEGQHVRRRMYTVRTINITFQRQ